MKKQYSHKKALSIIEIMVGIFIFTLWISAIYMIISSTSRINTYNKNYIIASNLAREQVELIRNIRDTNYAKLQKWNMLKPYWTDYHITFSWSTTHFYRLESDLTSGSGEIDVTTNIKVPNFKLSLKDITDTSEDIYRLCLDWIKYVYCTDMISWNLKSWVKETPFYRYIEIQQLTTELTWGTVITDAFKIQSKVFWNQKWVHSTEIPTILTDWKRL